MYILGISFFYHDSAVVLIKDGKIIFAFEEERFTRIKHDNSFPINAVQKCLSLAKIQIDDVDYISYYEKPLLKFERILETFVRTYPFSLKPFLKTIPEWIIYKIKIEQVIRKKLKFKNKIFFIPHHLSHASAAYFPSSFKQAAILTIDGVGEYETTVLWLAKDNKIKPIMSINFPDSLGMLYSTFTSFLGFRVNEGEYKVMGLAAYGKPNYVKEIYKIVHVNNDGSFQLDMKFFSFQEGFKMWSKAFEKIFGKPRFQNSPITKRDKDLAASIQKVTEEIYFKILNYLNRLTNCKNLCIGGGVALNALANGKIYKNTSFKNVYVLGASGDNGAAIGAALYSYHNILKNKKRFRLNNLYLGTQYSNLEIEKELKKNKLKYERLSEEKLLSKTAFILSQNKVVGWFQKRMEFGPRALGARSILSNPKLPDMKEKVNKIKIRELFRPFAGSILEKNVDQYFETPNKTSLFPFMNFCFLAKEQKKNEIASIVHRDGTCRIQTINKQNGVYEMLIKKFYMLTGIPCILNTSFNLKGEPIVENPDQAIQDFLKTKMDYLVIGNFLVQKINSKIKNNLL